MGTEVLRPQDCLIERIRVAPAAVFHRRKSCYGNGNPRFRKPFDQKKRFNNQSEPSVSKRSMSSEDLKKDHNNLGIGQITILRRGESLDSKIKADHKSLKKNSDDLIVFGTDRLGPEPEMLKSVLSPIAGGCRSDMYAGSAFSLSPSPSSLPLPSFFNKKRVSKIVAVDDSATRDLRRLLRLE